MSNTIDVIVRQHELIGSLTNRDIRSRYKQSVLGIFWALLQPLAMMLIYTMVFSVFAGVKTKTPYPVFAYVALVPWNFFSQGITTGSDCLVNNFSLITKIYFPREVFPISAILGKIVDLVLGILVLIPLFVFYHIQLSWTIILFVPILIIQICFMLGIVFMLSTINVFYRDIRHVVPLLVQIWMYLNPIVYPIERVPDKFMSLYMLNPMAGIMDSYRRVVLQGELPQWEYLGIATTISFLCLIYGYRLFKKYEPAFAEVI